MVFDDVLAVALTPWGLLVLGLVIGSFLNVVIHRLPLISEADWKVDARDILGLPEEPIKPEDVLTLSSPASRCPKCGHQIRWYENIPLISWLALRGKCSACKTPIPCATPGGADLRPVVHGLRTQVRQRSHRAAVVRLLRPAADRLHD